MTNEYTIRDVSARGTICYECEVPGCTRHIAVKQLAVAYWTMSGGCAGSAIVAGSTCRANHNNKLTLHTCECAAYLGHAIMPRVENSVGIYEAHRSFANDMARYIVYGGFGEPMAVIGEVLPSDDAWFYAYGHGTTRVASADYATADDALKALIVAHTHHARMALLALFGTVAA